MSKAIPISIIIPHYITRKQSIKHVLTSLAAQEYDHDYFEVIIVEDGIGDNNHIQYHDIFPQARIIKRYVHSGTACAKNIGARQARYTWLAFLDDDVRLSPQWLSNMVYATYNFPHIECFQSKVLFLEYPTILNSTGGVANIYGYAWDRGVFEYDKKQYDTDRYIMYASSCAMLIKKSLFENISGFDDTFFYMGEDYDLGIRIYRVGSAVAYVPEAVCFHEAKIEGKENDLQTKYFLERNRLLVILKNYEALLLLKLCVPLLFLKIFKYISYCFRFHTKRIVLAKDIVTGWHWICQQLPNIVTQRHEFRRLKKRTILSIFKDFDKYKYQTKAVISSLPHDIQNCNLS